MNRYARQQLVPGFGEDGQRKVASAHVLVAGAGGLGVPVLQYLAGAGVGRITLVDPDVVAEHNLHRQPLYRMSDVGRVKVHAAADALRALNPEVEVVPVAELLNPLNVTGLLDGCSLALDCGDNFAVSYILSDACLAAGMPLVSASALGMEGYVGGYCGGAPSLRAVFPELPESAGSCATAGVLGPVVGTIGMMQAQMALSVLLGLEPSPLGCLVTFDARNWRTSTFRFDEAVEPADHLLRFVAPGEVTPGDVAIELRGAEEAPEPAVPDALRMSMRDVQERFVVPDGARRVVMCCRTGMRAWRAARSLQARWPGEIVILAAGDSRPVGTGSPTDNCT
jgi:molybdopterin/thiamine biosynthesis adenylyltransferase/rhodanese-related sulfurtransferase